MLFRSLAAETEAEAERLFQSRALARMLRDRGVFAPLMSPEEAAAQITSDSDKMRLEKIRERHIFGTPSQVAAKLRALGESLGVEEIALLTTTHDPEARRRSYTLLAREFGMVSADAAAA